ncbi:MAG: Hsp20/alpha crystallin family protein [Nitrososphaerota archaeon]|jgi:HSP20 family molecular chaperone IbpA|nr:Hsp20/alpha crystallin family protein [Nitrososphaerota archaeon]
MREIGARSREVYEFIGPAVDMYEDGSELVVVVDLPGFEKESIRTRFGDSYLAVSARRETEEHDGVTYWEQRPLRLSRRIPLPVKVKRDEDTEIKATYKDGVLTIRLPIESATNIVVE